MGSNLTESFPPRFTTRQKLATARAVNSGRRLELRVFNQRGVRFCELQMLRLQNLQPLSCLTCVASIRRLFSRYRLLVAVMEFSTVDDDVHPVISIRSEWHTILHCCLHSQPPEEYRISIA